AVLRAPARTARSVPAAAVRQGLGPAVRAEPVAGPDLAASAVKAVSAPAARLAASMAEAPSRLLPDTSLKRVRRWAAAACRPVTKARRLRRLCPDAGMLRGNPRAS